MTTTSMVISPSLDISQNHLSDFENHTSGIISKLLREVGYYGQGIRNISQVILRLIVAKMRVKHEGLKFDGKEEKAMNTKTKFVKEKSMADLSC